MPLINCEVTRILNWYKKCVISSNVLEPEERTFAMNNTKLYVSVVTLLIQGNSKLFEQFKSGFKRTTNWDKYNSRRK